MKSIRQDYKENVDSIEELAEALFHEWNNQDEILNTTEFYLYKIWKFKSIINRLLDEGSIVSDSEIAFITTKTDIVIELEDIINI